MTTLAYLLELVRPDQITLHEKVSGAGETYTCNVVKFQIISTDL